MKIFDCFPFFNELELLELRLETYYDLVDRFVIVEADRTHANIPKPYNFRAHLSDFQKFLPKIHYVMDGTDVPYKGANDWSIENHQRNSIAKGLTDAAPDDLIMISDVDEFPHPDMLKRLRENFSDPTRGLDVIAFYDTAPYTKGKVVPFHCGIGISKFLDLSPVACQQEFHSYFFDWVCRENTWAGTVIGKFKHMRSPQSFRNARIALPRIVKGGWHFSSMGGIDKFLEKVRSAPDFSKYSDADKDFLIAAINSGKYLIGGSKFVPCDVNKIALPTLKTFLKKYPQFLRGA